LGAGLRENLNSLAPALVKKIGDAPGQVRSVILPITLDKLQR